MIYTIELRRAHEIICSISGRFEDDNAALANAQIELYKNAAEEAKVFKFGDASRDAIAILTPETT